MAAFSYCGCRRRLSRKPKNCLHLTREIKDSRLNWVRRLAANKSITQAAVLEFKIQAAKIPFQFLTPFNPTFWAAKQTLFLFFFSRSAHRSVSVICNRLSWMSGPVHTWVSFLKKKIHHKSPYTPAYAMSSAATKKWWYNLPASGRAGQSEASYRLRMRGLTVKLLLNITLEYWQMQILFSAVCHLLSSV